MRRQHEWQHPRLATGRAESDNHTPDDQDPPAVHLEAFPDRAFSQLPHLAARGALNCTFGGRPHPPTRDHSPETRVHLRFLAEVLSAEVDDRTDRRRTRRINEATAPASNAWPDFNVDTVPTIHAATLDQLASGGYMELG